MPDQRRIHFPPFSLDLVNECLWKGAQPIKLRPKAFAVLEHLVARPGQLVTKEHLIGHVWQGTFVGDAVLKVAIRQIREALADDPQSPRYIETAHRRGYRFIGRIDAAAGSPAHDAPPPPSAAAALPERHANLPEAFVGREPALGQLRRAFERARSGERQVVFISGEAGIGKTTLLDAFTAELGLDGSARICSGQCLEQYGAGEPYLPILEAIGRLCRSEPEVVPLVRAHAPMWLLQLPSVLTSADRELFGRELVGATRERMLREMSEALDALTAITPLLLVLEDLHWSDHSTLDLISYIARRRGTSHLLIAATCRPADLIVSGHPLKGLKQELLAKQLCEEISLDYLSEEAVAQHMRARFPRSEFPPELPALIHERTEGNPLFMVSTIDYLVAEGYIEPSENGWRMSSAIDIVKVGVPESIRHLIETQIDRLDGADQRLLEAASVAGAECSTPALAAALVEPLDAVEARCEDLSRRHQFLRGCGVVTLPDGSTAGRYAFVHSVYRHVFYERIAVPRRVQLHRRIAERGEELFGERAAEIAAELAMHFEEAGRLEQAARYLRLAAHNAIRRSAYGEAALLARRGLAAVESLPDTPDRGRAELQLLITLGVPLIATEGYAAPAVGAVYTRGRELCARLGETPELSQVLWGLWTFHTLRADLASALDIGREFLRLADVFKSADMAMRGHWAMEVTFTHQGAFAPALDHFDRGLARYHPDRHRDDGYYYAMNPGVALRCFAAWSQWFLGRPDAAVECVGEAVTLARVLSEPPSLAHALLFAAMLHQLRREPARVREYAEAAIDLSREHDLGFYLAMAKVAHGWTLVGVNRQDAIVEMNDGIAGWSATGASLLRPHFLGMLAEAFPSGDAQGLRALEEALALADATGERCYEAELHRLKGERLLRRDGADARLAAEACFARALEIARRQQALSLELRAAVSLARLHRRAGRHDAAHGLLRPVCDRFTEGFETVDFREALDLLRDLAPRL